MGMTFDEGFRADLIINDLFLIKSKPVEPLAPVHSMQLLTYFRLRKTTLGLLIDFGTATSEEGVKRIVNNRRNLAGSRLDLNR